MVAEVKEFNQFLVSFDLDGAGFPGFRRLFHEGDNVTVFVTSGVGTSILPLRLGAKSNCDLIFAKVAI